MLLSFAQIWAVSTGRETQHKVELHINPERTWKSSWEECSPEL